MTAEIIALAKAGTPYDVMAAGVRVAEIARRLSVPTSTVRRWVRS